MLRIEWICDKCSKQICLESPPVSDSYELYHPDGVHWFAEEDKEFEYCEECFNLWWEEELRKNPDSVWIA